jgi:hypothetical protein
VGPAMWIGMWDPERDDAALLEACAVSLEGAGARVRRTTHDDGRAMVVVDHYPALCPPGEDLAVEPPRDASNLGGGLVATALRMPWFDEQPEPAAAWARFLEAIGRLLADVQPLLVACPVELGVDELPDPDPADADGLFRTGWVDPDRLDPPRREAFDRALRDGPRTELAGGWWWSADPDRDPAHRGAADGSGLSRAIYAAWTGDAVPAAPLPVMTAADASASEPQLWWWAADRADGQLLADVAAWAEREGYHQGDVELGTEGAPGWFPVIVSLGWGADPAGGLASLRRAVAAVRPSWAALQPESGLLVPGVDLEIPASGVLEHVWVGHDWIGGRLDRLAQVLDGAHREELAGGTLFVTDPGLSPQGRFADWARDPEARWDRLVEAAVVLAEAARASREPP